MFFVLLTWDGANPFRIMKSEFDPELISAYLDGELTSKADRELVEQHLAETSADAQMLDDFRQMGTLLRELPSESTPPGLREAVRNQIERETLLSHPVDKARRPLRGSRIVQMVASVSLLMLISTVGTFYYMSQQMTSKSDTSALVMMEASPQSSDIETDRLVLESAKKSEFGSSLNLATEHKENDLAVMDGNGDENGDENGAGVAVVTSESVVASKTRSMKRSKAVRAAPALKELRAAKLAPAAMTGFTEEIPPLPAVLSKKSINFINTLATSPKLHGILKPGELVRYVTSNTITQDVNIVELSVVDVEEAFGTVQVLLSNNEIVPASQIQMAHSDGDNDSSKDQPTPFEKPSLENKKKQEGMVALYVEASQEQVLNSLVQLDGLKNIRQLYVGTVPNLTDSSYGVEPVAEDETGLKKFEINQETTSSPLISAGEKSKKQPATALDAPRWRVLTNLNELDKMSLAKSLFTQTGNRKGYHKEAVVMGKNKKQSSGTHAGEYKNKKGKRDATSFSVVQSADSFSYQIPVHLTPGSKNKSNSREIAVNAKPFNGNSPQKEKTLSENKHGDQLISAGKDKQKPGKQIPKNHLRLLLIISLNEGS